MISFSVQRNTWLSIWYLKTDRNYKKEKFHLRWSVLQNVITQDRSEHKYLINELFRAGAECCQVLHHAVQLHDATLLRSAQHARRRVGTSHQIVVLTVPRSGEIQIDKGVWGARIARNWADAGVALV